MSTTDFAHLSESGQARMVDVGEKTPTNRTARAEAYIDLGRQIAEQLRATGAIAKGNVVDTARIAGIMAAKQTSSLVPMCHPLLLDHISIDAEWEGDLLRIESCVRCTGTTGVEMEALTAVSVAALTVYDMCKSAGKGIEIRSVRLLEKTGGKSGSWQAESGRNN
ncbi:MAG: cyclic pyranopterin monophosphate synthase MoaC [Kiritimatiellia bacterium]|jgi:cyclic pyranopterin phosphate synthase|nr:cyclic pyranopterin monophosphate synthase MoaC [Kiritimatiellia bacterium]MDP6630436.1 cyclic pyranopterin monophosphate synthase MoaC [Kiritimatiellia bacterium]MDP6809893.1 cyclic pyranopterin monophosphate synthase MoaC [Kiritimatiellia bacterium]MDP7024285.1 cyclic pyranopterin monophosphate synthase MoaC [Kiritimatiellia bacterium]